MQCAACRAVYSNALEQCPRCAAPADSGALPQVTRTTTAHAPSRREARAQSSASVAPQETAVTPETKSANDAPASAPSTLIEFPGAGRGPRPQWRKELSERVREIQERRAREAAQEVAESALRETIQPAPQPATAPPLGLVPQPETPPLNPIVVAALRRLERARQPGAPPAASRARAGASGAATATARIIEERPESNPDPLPQTEAKRAQLPVAAKAGPLLGEEAGQSAAARQPVSVEAKGGAAEPPKPRANLAVVASPAPAPEIPAETSKPQPRRVREEVIDDAVLSRICTDYLPKTQQETYDDRAPLGARIMGEVIDLCAIAFISAPFAALIELTSGGRWEDMSVVASFGGIVLTIMFLYLTASVALAGRTWGMRLASIRVVDARAGMAPTTGQCVRRALGHMLSLATLGIGLLYALFDADGRTAHDYLSGTIVVRD